MDNLWYLLATINEHGVAERFTSLLMSTEMSSCCYSANRFPVSYSTLAVSEHDPRVFLCLLQYTGSK
jgi:hypothetical protein